MSWDDRWMDMATLVASWSKDRSRKVGAVIVDERNIVVSLGWNGFPRGIDDTIESRHQRPAKYKYTVHAEMNCILNIRNHFSLDNCKMYVTLYPCAHCAQSIIQSGIKYIIAPEPNWDDATYKDDFSITRELFYEAGITVFHVDGEHQEAASDDELKRS